MEENNQGSGSKRIYLAIIFLLLLINGVLLWLAYNQNKQKEEQIVEVQKKDTEMKSLNQQFDSAKQELESLKGKNSELDSIINVRVAEIAGKQAELDAALKSGRLNAGEVNKYKVLAAKYKTDNEELQKKIQELTSQNQELTAQNLAITQKLDVEKNTTSALNQELSVKQKKVELGSLLQLQNMKVEGVHKKKNGKEVVEKSGKKCDYLKISFETGANKVLEKGPLALYLRIINPKGETIALSDQGSGTMKLADEGGDAQYSRKLDLDWTQESLKETIEWSQNIKDPGTYKIEVYQAGYLVGKSSVDLK
jgi:hypothetical protein